MLDSSSGRKATRAPHMQRAADLSATFRSSSGNWRLQLSHVTSTVSRPGFCRRAHPGRPRTAAGRYRQASAQNNIINSREPNHPDSQLQICRPFGGFGVRLAGGVGFCVLAAVNLSHVKALDTVGRHGPVDDLIASFVELDRFTEASLSVQGSLAPYLHATYRNTTRERP